jgi:hypothetical protein
MQFNNLEQYYINETLIQETADQIIKDFSEFSFELTFTGEKERPYDELFGQLRPIIEYLLEKEQEKFMSIIYRIDLDEAALKNALFPSEDGEPAQLIADLIIQRELKKVVIRNYFKQQAD